MFPALSKPPLNLFLPARKPIPPFVLPSWPRLLLREACGVQLKRLALFLGHSHLSTQFPALCYLTLPLCGSSQATLQHPGRQNPSSWEGEDEAFLRNLPHSGLVCSLIRANELHVFMAYM